MFKDGRYINAGTNEYYRWGRKAKEKLEEALNAHNGYYSVVADGGKYWTFGTSNGKFGEFAKYKDTFFSVNSYGFIYAKANTDKGVKFVEMIEDLIKQMEESGAE